VISVKLTIFIASLLLLFMSSTVSLADVSESQALEIYYLIGYSATKSTMSGRLYEVQCPGEEPVPSSEWLLEELEVHRKR
jgi:hypothetical protein